MPDWTTADLAETSLVRELRETLTDTQTMLRGEQETNLLLVEESYSQLELANEDLGWRALIAQGVTEFSDAGMRRIAALCQLMWAKNPLIIRGLAIRAAYTWGEGVTITARAQGDDGSQDVNAVVQGFLDDDGNEEAFTGPAARVTLSAALDTDGQVFLALFTAPRTGTVRVRPVPFLEITDVICNPDDRCEPWFYQRDFVTSAFDPATGVGGARHQTVFYPALGYAPKIRPGVVSWNGVTGRVQWDAPMLHVSLVRPLGWKFALPVVYGAIDWARAYGKFLSNWATLCEALSRYAFTQTGPGRKHAAARAALAAPPTRTTTGEVLAVGSTVQLGPDQTLVPVPKTGATLDSESGRPLAAMTGAALGVPVTMMLGDPGVTGARATAATLDRPFEVGMELLRQIWEYAERRVLNHVIDSSIKAPLGKLTGAKSFDDDGREVWELGDETDRTIDFVWPTMNDVPLTEKITAIVTAFTTGRVPDLIAMRLLLTALGLTGVDEIVADFTGPDGEFLDPNAPVVPPVPPPDPLAPPPVPDGRIGVRGYHRAPRAKPDPNVDPTSDPTADPGSAA